ncbi:DUF881 domain-containing protein [Kyrpidia tusciae]|uniref:DUF881 domain-containing protein n=1 Tax=Kyrpidia tusciae (strain DSM 2912 / NBRC 15312 / T2) TaxID=562970 RepID=D5WQE3_KYRT2|nr:DUF881 domain-containing protein [Kyrpidia tusciae]ADG06552.1 protein of unknown function DUF881 [Kyrpidia tusciae DSM 2912]
MADTQGPQVTGRSKRTLYIILFAASLIVGFMAAVQISTVRQPATARSDIVELRSELAQQQAKQEGLLKTLDDLQHQLEKYQATGGNRAGMAEALVQEVQDARRQAGLEPASGPGVIVTIRDLPGPAITGQDTHVYDWMLQMIVNLLYGNGAEGIALNGQRLITTSFIREVNGVMQVDTHPISMPYVIAAVGDPDRMQAALTINPIVQDYRQIGKEVTIEVRKGGEVVHLPAYHDPVEFRFAKKEVTGGS